MEDTTSKWHNYVKCSLCGREIEVFGNFQKDDKIHTPTHKEHKKDKTNCFGGNILSKIYIRLGE